ncbi:Receptor for ATP that acts as a ligand-gated ion channel [Sparganum proliferum]
MSALWQAATSTMFNYSTQKVVQLNSKWVGVFFRLMQLGIILYVIVWVMIFQKGYQKFDEALSGVTAKVRGVDFTNTSAFHSSGLVVWDAADYVIPPQQKAAFFVMTSVGLALKQTLGFCEESPYVAGSRCVSAQDCRAGELLVFGNGIKTGRCIPSSLLANVSVCEIYSWCPGEHQNPLPATPLRNAPNFTVLLKNSIEFPTFQVKRRNIFDWMDVDYLETCLYDRDHETMRYCPRFRIGDIIKYSGGETEAIWTQGGIVAIRIDWTCNLDYDVEDCLPSYSFHRLDDSKSLYMAGWNLRYADHFVEQGGRARYLVKANGIQFVITVHGTGGKFDFLTFSMNLGSGLALLGIATLLCDMIVLNFVRKRSMYRKAKVDLLEKQRRKMRVSRVRSTLEEMFSKSASVLENQNEPVSRTKGQTADGRRHTNRQRTRSYELQRQSDFRARNELTDRACPAIRRRAEVSATTLSSPATVREAPRFHEVTPTEDAVRPPIAD